MAVVAIERAVVLGTGDTVERSDLPEALLLDAEVRWAIDEANASAPGVPGAGMGIKFAPLEVESLVALQNYFSTLHK